MTEQQNRLPTEFSSPFVGSSFAPTIGPAHDERTMSQIRSSRSVMSSGLKDRSGLIAVGSDHERAGQERPDQGLGQAPAPPTKERHVTSLPTEPGDHPGMSL